MGEGDVIKGSVGRVEECMKRHRRAEREENDRTGV